MAFFHDSYKICYFHKERKSAEGVWSLKDCPRKLWSCLFAKSCWDWYIILTPFVLTSENGTIPICFTNLVAKWEVCTSYCIVSPKMCALIRETFLKMSRNMYAVSQRRQVVGKHRILNWNFVSLDLIWTRAGKTVRHPLVPKHCDFKNRNAKSKKRFPGQKVVCVVQHFSWPWLSSWFHIPSAAEFQSEYKLGSNRAGQVTSLEATAPEYVTEIKLGSHVYTCRKKCSRFPSRFLFSSTQRVQSLPGV